MKNLSRLFFVAGILCYMLGIYNLWLSQDPNRLSFSKYSYAQRSIPENKTKLKQELPQRIIIKSLNIDIPVIPSKIEDTKWETTDQGASYLGSSPVPGETGNSIIYGHNWASLFANLIYIVPGQEVQIVYEDGKTKTFVVKYTSVVTPDTSSILAPTKDKRITLYTCTGFLDSHRFVAVAVLKDK